MTNKPALRRTLQSVLAELPAAARHRKSLAACEAVATSPEFAAAQVLMLFLSTPLEIDTAPLALRCWQAGKTVVVPRVAWDQKRMLAVEITSLHTDMKQVGPNNDIREPIAGKPVPVDFIDLVIVPGLGFSPAGHRIGRGMGFYDRFLAQPEFVGTSCRLAFAEQVLADVPTLDHDVPLDMLATDRGLRRFGAGEPSDER